MTDSMQNFTLQTGSMKPVAVSIFAVLEYQSVQQAMMEFASKRGAEELDRVWLLQHPPVYTQGVACQKTPFNSTSTVVIKTDRGGQITYHGPGQVIMYPMLALRPRGLSVKSLVFKLEQSVIDLLAERNIPAERLADAPGVYVNRAKIAAVGLRIRRGTSYHGLSLNVDMDLSPFSNIDPCGYQGLRVTQVADYMDNPDVSLIGRQLLAKFMDLI